MKRLLFIDDDEKSTQSTINSLKRKIPDFDHKMGNFREAKTLLNSFQPDAVILDLLDGTPSNAKIEGLKTYELIWENRFCPIVIYSAEPQHVTEHLDHPFIKSVQKALRGPSDLVKALAKLLPHVTAIKDAEKIIRQQFSDALRDVAPHAFSEYKDETQRKEAILRSGRRRLAALMDEPLAPDEKLASWEKYLCPPIGKNLKLGDIICLIGSKETDSKLSPPESHRVILTPSCDLAAGGSREPKVKNVLVAHCCSSESGIQLLNISTNKSKRKDSLKKILSSGYHDFLIPLPSLEGRIPNMMVNLKNLELITISKKGSLQKKYSRIASIDSPFRELISWAYMQVACRPGLPDRNFEGWSDEIIKSLPSGQG
ncbi:MAG: response regulator [Nitrospina sp.]|jgi:hypothetical protein|nr:response regulator [Nitrospina sp.]